MGHIRAPQILIGGYDTGVPWFEGPTTRMHWRYQRPINIESPPGSGTFVPAATAHEIVSTCAHVMFTGSDCGARVPTGWYPAFDAAHGHAPTWKQAYVLEGYSGIWHQYTDPMFARYSSTGMNDGDPCSGGDAFTSSPAFQDPDYCSILHGTHAYFLHNGAGNRIFCSSSINPNQYIMDIDPAGPWLTFAKDRYNPTKPVNLIKMRDYPQYNESELPTPDAQMIMLDDIWQDLRNAASTTAGYAQPDGNADHAVQEYSDMNTTTWASPTWLSNITSFCAGIQSVTGGIPITLNSDDPSQASDHPAGQCNGGFECEFFATGWGGAPGEMSQTDIEIWMGVTDTAVANGKIVELVSWPYWDRTAPYTTYLQGYRMGHAAYLMVCHPNTFWRFVDDGVLYPPDVGQGRALMPECLYNLGKPTGARSKPYRSDILERTFTAGKALLNMGATSYTNYPLNGSYYLPDNSGPITQYTLPAHDGIVLRSHL